MADARPFHDLFTRIVQAASPADLEPLVDAIIDWPQSQERLDLARTWRKQWSVVARGVPIDLERWRGWQP
jgi:hypothetical protein